jgi:hypothetical protein
VPQFSPHQAYHADLRDSLFATFAVSASSAHSQSLSANATAFYVKWKATHVVLFFFFFFKHAGSESTFTVTKTTGWKLISERKNITRFNH